MVAKILGRKKQASGVAKIWQRGYLSILWEGGEEIRVRVELPVTELIFNPICPGTMLITRVLELVVFLGSILTHSSLILSVLSCLAESGFGIDNNKTRAARI